MSIKKFASLISALMVLTSLFFASDEIAVSIQVQSEFKSFSGRLERRLRDTLAQDSNIDVMESGIRVGGHEYNVGIELRYPVRPFSGESGLYVKLKGLAGDRYLYYYHSSLKNGDLSIAQGDRLIQQVSEDLLDVILTETHIKKGNALNVGYYENRRKVSLGEPLEVELLALKHQDWRDLGLSDRDRQEKLKDTSLLQEVRIDREKPDLDSPMPTSRREALEHKTIIKKLDQTWSPEERADLYRQLAGLYERNGLLGDARRFASEALEEDRSQASSALVHRLEGDERYPLERFRRSNLDRKLLILWQNLLNYDSNVVLEEVDNYSPTDSRDWLLSTALHLEQEWGWHFADTIARTSYDLLNETYMRYEELDLLSQRLGQSFSKRSTLGSSFMEWRLGLGYSYYLHRGRSLMQGLDVQLGSSWTQSPQDIFSLMLTWQEKTFSDHFYSKAERDGDVLRLEGAWRKKFQEDQILWTRAGLLKDQVGDQTLSYEATTLGLEYEAKSPWPWLGTLTGSFGYERRWYQAPEFGRVERQDAKFEYGIESRLHPFNAHTFRMKFLHTDGQSTRRVSFYRREQVLLHYDISF